MVEICLIMQPEISQQQPTVDREPTNSDRDNKYMCRYWTVEPCSAVDDIRLTF